MRKYLRWDVPIGEPEASDYLAGYTYPTPILGSRRPRLGQAAPGEPVEKLDFDGDGKRDLGYWVPPTTIGGTGTFTALLSSNGFSTSVGQKVQVSFGGLGDIPVPADYNGDGRTDFGVFQPGGGINRDSPEDTAAYWRWCPTAPSAPTTSCASVPAPVQYGSRSDTPQAGLEMDGAAGNELSVYRPSNGGWYYRNVSGTFTGSKSLGQARVGVVPMPGLYDCDSLTDLAVYEPNTAQFKLLRSEDGWSSQVMHQFDPQFVPFPSGVGEDRSGVVALSGFTTSRSCLVGGTVLVSRRRRAPALFYPEDGTWNVIWNPTAATSVQSCGYGAGGTDQPIPGLDRDGDLRSELALFRPPTSFGGSGTIYTRLGSPTSCGGANLNVSCAGCGPKSRVFAVADMTGDGLPEVLVYGFEGRLTWLTSESNYSSVGGNLAFDPDAVVL